MRQIFISILLSLVFSVAKAQIIPEGTYIIRSCVDSNHVIDLRSSNASNGNNIHIWTNNNTYAQRWYVAHSNGAIVLQSLVNQFYVIDLSGSVTQDGNNIHIWQMNDTNAQRWIPEYDNGAYILHSAVDPNYVLDLNGSNIEDGNNIHLWTKNGTNAQRWIFEKVNGVYSNGGNQVIVPAQDDMPCVGCGGTKRCSICNGKGYTVSASNRLLHHQCGACDGTGECQVCKYR